jgi:hypothetical protein
MTSPLTSSTRFYICDSLFIKWSSPKNKFKTSVKNLENKTNTPTFVDNKAFEDYNAFYNNNNYIYPDEYKQKTEWSITEPDLPEWYNTDFDQEIVDDMINEYGLFYDPYMSVEKEQIIEDEYQRQNEITESDSSDSEGEWCNVD